MRRALDKLCVGDTRAVWSLDRLGRDLRHLLGLTYDLDKAGAGLWSLREGIDTTGPAGRLVFSVLEVIGEFKRGRIRERTRLGVLRARRHRFWGHPPVFSNPEKIRAA